MEYVGGTSLKQLLKARMREAVGPTTRCPSTRRSPTCSRCSPRSRTCTTSTSSTATSSRTTSSRWATPCASSTSAGVRRIDDVDPRSTAPSATRPPRSRRSARRWPRTLHHRPHPRRARDGVPGLPEHLREQPAAARRHSVVPVGTTLYRLLLKACAPDPADRFASADELRVQLLGVLREVVAQHRRGAAEHSTSSAVLRRPHRGR